MGVLPTNHPKTYTLHQAAEAFRLNGVPTSEANLSTMISQGKFPEFARGYKPDVGKAYLVIYTYALYQFIANMTGEPPLILNNPEAV